MKCPNCGIPNDENTVSCYNCGHEINQTPIQPGINRQPQQSPKENSIFKTLAMLAIILLFMFAVISFFINNNSTNNQSANISDNDYSDTQTEIETDFPNTVLYFSNGHITVEDARKELLNIYDRLYDGKNSAFIIRAGTITSAELDYEYIGMDGLKAIFQIDFSIQGDDCVEYYRGNVVYLKRGDYLENYYTLQSKECGLWFLYYGNS